MRIKPQYISTTIGEETVIVPTGDSEFRGIARGNKTVGVIVDLLREDTSEEAIVAALYERYEAEEGTIERSVARVLSELRRMGALEE